MSLRINTNVDAMGAQRNLNATNMALSKSMERLSSGLKINRASDDAAGLAVSEKMRAQVKGLNQAVENTQAGVNLVQTAEGALDSVTTILQRVRVLSVQAANDTLTTQDRNNIQAEITQQLLEVDRIANSVSFNTKNLLDGTFTNMSLQIGANSSDTLTIGITTVNATNLTINNLSVGSATLASQAIASLDVAIQGVLTQRATLGAIQNRLEMAISNLGVQSQNLAAAESRIRDTDFATEVTTMTRNQIIQQSGTAMLSQANQSPQAALSLLR